MNEFNNEPKKQPWAAPNIIPNNMASASLTVGLLAFLANCCACMPSGVPIGFILGVAGAALAVLSKKEGSLSKPAIIGLILSILSVITGLLLFYIIIEFYTLIRDPVNGAAYNKYFTEMWKALFQTAP